MYTDYNRGFNKTSGYRNLRNYAELALEGTDGLGRKRFANKRFTAPREGLLWANSYVLSVPYGTLLLWVTNGGNNFENV